MFKWFNIVLSLAVAIHAGCQTATVSPDAGFCQFAGLADFSRFSTAQNQAGETILTSPEIRSRIAWNELIVSWNAAAPAGTYLKIEARAFQPDHATKFFSWGRWSADDLAFPRSSETRQKDVDGDVRADTLGLNQVAEGVQIRITLGGTNGHLPSLKFLGLAFCNTQIKPEALPPNRAAWGKVIPVVERSQQPYRGGNGWCSPTSLSMVLALWGGVSQRADWNLDAPEVAAGVADHGFKFPTGNWSYNTAFAGSLDGMRAYVTRFCDISELEDWIAAGIPVIISARYDLLQDGRADDFSGHLTVCRGFTENGDLVVNDPWSDLKTEHVRHVYKRENVRRAWATSHETVYLVYPEGTQVPRDRFGHWFTPHS